ncbi:hypothetical protein C7B77_28545 [Chamaesiphon polymorphus CCALA 037]|uniref:Uncharacterized protein n=1 Tax=Chamaesiphon polymorphus CCALA 037 TaxID=2107692 RepID=A0A2T1F5S5_9CYAN|nr:hypothetical protein C7B77_28545 [Chamaesiphon polymorphus CCALA 037]
MCAIDINADRLTLVYNIFQFANYIYKFSSIYSQLYKHYLRSLDFKNLSDKLISKEAKELLDRPSIYSLV